MLTTVLQCGGSNISCVEISSNSAGVIETSWSYIAATASTLSSYDSSKHITSWTLKIYSLGFDIVTSDEAKKRTIAHEIGHVYGLGHVEDTSAIMYTTSSETKAVTSADIRGMKVMTHMHTHSISDGNIIEPVGPDHHKVRCATCMAFKRVECVCSSHWHSGNYHYYQYDCSACGNDTLRKTPCNSTICPIQSVIQ